MKLNELEDESQTEVVRCESQFGEGKLEQKLDKSFKGESQTEVVRCQSRFGDRELEDQI